MIALAEIMSEETGNWYPSLAARRLSQKFNAVHVLLLYCGIIDPINYNNSGMLRGDVRKVN